MKAQSWPGDRDYVSPAIQLHGQIKMRTAAMATVAAAMNLVAATPSLTGKRDEYVLSGNSNHCLTPVQRRRSVSTISSRDPPAMVERAVMLVDPL